jgi:myo-inositol-1(or 4)-monophosphatase
MTLNMTHNVQNLLATAKEAARIGGDILIKGFRRLKKSQIRMKGCGDYVTEMDHRSEEAIIQRIKRSFPDHHIHAEESGADSTSSRYRWYIDPLDGTTNYVHGVATFSVSIAAALDGETVLGIVFDPVQKVMFWATRGQGAYLNADPIRVSEKKTLEECFLASGFPWRSKQYIDAYLSSFRELFSIAAGVRRMGSAAIDLAYTACSRFDGFWEMKLKPWDIAAGVIILREAGGIASDFLGGDHFMTTGNLVAANPFVFPKMLEVVKKHLEGVE